MYSFFRIIRFALQDIGRNLGLSTMTVFILLLMLLSINTLWSMDVMTKEAVRLVKEQINISFYLTPAISDKSVSEIKSYLATFPEITQVDLLTRDQVLQSFKTRHQFSAEVLDALSELGGNPFGPTLVVKTKEPGDYRKIIQAVSVPEYDPLIEGKSFEGHEEALDRIQTITNRIERVGLGLSLLFALISFLIIFNTIRVAIFTQRAEISIKRLVGANNWFIRGPYLLESLIFTVVSVALTILIMYFATRYLDRYVSVVFPNGFSLTNYYSSHMLYLFGIQTVAVLLLTVFSSSLAMRRQLKV
ncbi:MAG: FtsX-like permease family protein [Candidatus Magasanikbacteria bacterium]|nr:FtsX-like permease family protein [Candidatus Magasanikbacteria bacterium]